MQNNTKKGIHMHLRSILMLALLLVILFALSYTYCMRLKEFSYTETQLQRDLGFVHGTPFIEVGDDQVEVLTIHQVIPGGVFDRAGFKERDMVVDDLSVSGLYETLEASRGQWMSLNVVEYGDSRLAKSPSQRTLRFLVPIADQRDLGEKEGSEGEGKPGSDGPVPEEPAK